jgi:tetratricopeptide (TPR) repeat protein
VNLSDTMRALRHARDSHDVATAERIARLMLREHAGEQMPLHAAGHALLSLGSFDLAVTVLEAALALHPRAEIWNDLGVALQRRGEIERATTAYRSAVAERPDFTEAHANLAAALFLIGANREALEHAETAAARSPDAPGITTTLAMIEGAMFGQERALARLDAGLAGRPDDVGMLSARVFVLRRLERPAEALPSARRLVELAPEAKSHELLGMVLRDLGRHADALAALDAAIALAPNPATALSSAGETLLDLGDIPAARERYTSALAADPQNLGGWIGLSQVQRFAPDDPGLATMEALLDTPLLAMREERTMLHFALGKAHLGAGNDERAFFHFHAGNRLRRETIVYHVANDERRAEAIVATIDAATIARLSGAFRSTADPIVVMGMPRSGTSLIEQILATLPGVYGAGELPFARRIIEGPGPYPATTPALDTATVAGFGAAYAAALAALAPPGARVVDKMPSNFLYAGMLHAMLPNARLVFCTRDPLDNGLSLYTSLFSGRQDFSYDLAEIGRYYRAHEGIVAHWKRVLPPASFIEIRYEDIVTDFDTTIGRLLAFCGLPWDDACRRFYETPRTVATASRTEVRQPLYRSSIGRAQRYAAYLQPLVQALHVAAVPAERSPEHR